MRIYKLRPDLELISRVESGSITVVNKVRFLVECEDNKEIEEFLKHVKDLV